MSDAPPHDLDAEGAVIGWLVDHPSESGLLRGLEPRHFYSDANRHIFAAALTLGDAWDLTQVASVLQDAGKLTQIGGTPYLIQLLDHPACSDPAPHAARIREMWARRELRLLSQEAAAVSATQDSTDTLERLEERVASLRGAARPVQSSRITSREIFARVDPTVWVSQPLDLCRPAPPAVVGGYAFSGKTAITQALELAVAVQRPIWGCFDCRRSRVLHADWEQGARLSRKRFQRLAVGMQIDPTELFEGDWLRYELLGPYLTEPRAEAYWTKASEDRDLLVLDSLRALAPGLDENSSEFRKVLDMGFRASERTGCLWLFLVHSKKPAQTDSDDGRMKLRGSSAIFDAASSVLLLELQKDHSVRVTHEKARETGRPQPPFIVRFHDIDEGDDQYAGLLVEAEAEPSREERRKSEAESRDKTVLEAVIATPWLSARQLAAVTGLHRQHIIQPALDRLELARAVKWRTGPHRATLWGPCEEAQDGS